MDIRGARSFAQFVSLVTSTRSVVTSCPNIGQVAAGPVSNIPRSLFLPCEKCLPLTTLCGDDDEGMMKAIRS